MQILKKLEILKSEGKFTQYNQELSKLSRRYPQIRDMVKSMKIDTNAIDKLSKS